MWQKWQKLERSGKGFINKAETAGYTESQEFSPALGLTIFGKKSVATNLR